MEQQADRRVLESEPADSTEYPRVENAAYLQTGTVAVESGQDQSPEDGFASREHRNEYLINLGITPSAIIGNSVFRSLPIDVIEKRLLTLEEMGFDGAVVLSRGKYVVTMDDITLHRRIDNLTELKLDTIRVVNRYPCVLNYSVETICAKMHDIACVLRRIGSLFEPKDIVNANPVILGLSMDKFHAMIDILQGSMSAEYISSLSAKQLSHFATLPIDTVFTAVAKQKLVPGYADKGLTRGQIAGLQTKIPATNRRELNLNILADIGARRAIGARAINAYARYANITKGDVYTGAYHIRLPDVVTPEYDRTDSTWLVMEVDAKWFESAADYPLDFDDIQHINEIIKKGSRKNEGSSMPTEETRSARREFFEDVLLWGYKKHPLHEQYKIFHEEHPDLIEPSVFVYLARRHEHSGVDIKNLILSRGVHVMRETHVKSTDYAMRHRNYASRESLFIEEDA